MIAVDRAARVGYPACGRLVGMALALYRRYRPDTFDGVIGQDQVTIPLMRALDAGKLTHAYLFSGPRGCGKTSSARILARCINCAKGPTSHPCGECASCKDLATGGPGSIDVVEIDAASHNGVDDARELRERAGFAPARDRYKIFILDEAHMVTQQGFNALLKIVEEPPEHVMFIFATTEPDKVIGTIRSRTHHYPFRLVPQEIMGPYLESICAKESIKPEAGVLKLAMRAGGGSVRDTLSVLDQLMVGAVDGVISHDSAVALLGFTPDALIGEAIDAVIDRNGEALYGVIQKVVVGGFDPRRFVEDLLARVRDLLVLLLAGEKAESVMSDTAEGEDMADLQRQASALGLASLTAMADTINTTLGSMTGAISPRMRLELLAARLLAGAEHGFAMPDAGGAGATTGAADGGAPAGVTAGAANVAPRAGGFAGSSRNQRTGFAGSSRNQVVAVTAESAATRPQSSEETASAARAEGNESATRLPLSGGAVTRSVTEGVKEVPVSSLGQAPSPEQSSSSAQTATQAPAPQETAPDTRTPDEKWDALIAALPADVRRYVDRHKIPKILLSADKEHAGRQRLWLKFDKSLSKYAFALAVADEAVDGTTNVVSILRNQVHAMFGQNVSIAPTNRMADGSVAPPFSKLPQDQQQKVKAQLLQESLQAAVAKTSAEATGAQESGDREQHTSSAAESAGQVDDDEVHRADTSGTSVSDVADVADAARGAVHDAAAQGDVPADDDPWADGDAGSSASAAGSSVTAASSDDDPWAQPAPATPSSSSSSAAQPTAVPHPSPSADPWNQPSAETNQPATAAHPNPSADPWNQPAPLSPSSVAHTAAPAAPQPAPGAPPQPSPVAADPWDQSIPLPDVAPPDDDPWAAQQPIPVLNRHQPPIAQPQQSFTSHLHAQPAGAFPQQPTPPQPFQSPSQSTPQVAPDEDEYSMSDESLGTATAMSVEELQKFFEVKKVEEFKADDPKNPRNLLHANKHEE